MDDMIRLLEKEEKRLDDNYEAALVLRTYRDEFRLSPFLGRKMKTGLFDTPDAQAVSSIFDAIVVGCVHPLYPHSWGVDEDTVVKNHPKWSTTWPTVVEIPETDVLAREYQMPTTEADLVDLSERIDRYADMDGMADVSERLAAISEEVNAIMKCAKDFHGPEVGWYMMMGLSPHLSDCERFQPLILTDILSYVASTTKYLNGNSMKDEIVPLDKSDFLKLHEEVALAEKLLGDTHYASLAEMLIDDTEAKIDDFVGILGDDVISKFGSFSEAMTMKQLHCIDFSAAADRVVATPLHDKPEFIKTCLYAIPRPKKTHRLHVHSSSRP